MSPRRHVQDATVLHVLKVAGLARTEPTAALVDGRNLGPARLEPELKKRRRRTQWEASLSFGAESRVSTGASQQICALDTARRRGSNQRAT